MTEILISTRLRQARDLDANLNSETEKSRIGTLRGGSSGILSPDGAVAGKCVRLSLLRSLGISADEKFTEDKYVIFDRGRDQEFSILEDLRNTLLPDEVLLTEDEIPTEWYTGNGTRVTGRPDGVICSLDKTPKLGLEIKSVGSFWVTRNVLLDKSPPLPNLIQSAHYAWQLGSGTQPGPVRGLAYKLIYRQNSSLIIPAYPFLTKLFPRADQTEHELYDLIKFNKAGKLQEIKPYTIVYDLRLDSAGVLSIKLETETIWRQTVVSISMIREYFEYVSRMQSSKNLGPRPTSVDAWGNQLGFNPCDYCPLQDTCDTYESAGFDEWLKQIKLTKLD